MFISHAAVRAHQDGDCWSWDCPCCAWEDEQERIAHENGDHALSPRHLCPDCVCEGCGSNLPYQPCECEDEDV